MEVVRSSYSLGVAQNWFAACWGSSDREKLFQFSLRIMEGRRPQEALWYDLMETDEEISVGATKTLQRIWDWSQPSNLLSMEASCEDKIKNTVGPCGQRKVLVPTTNRSLEERGNVYLGYCTS